MTTASVFALVLCAVIRLTVDWPLFYTYIYCGNFSPVFCFIFLQYIQYCCENAPHLDVKYSRKSLLPNDAVLL